MALAASQVPQSPQVDVRRGFESFDADDLEVLDVFLDDAQVVSASRFANHLDKLGARPTLMIDRRFPGGGGEGRIRVTAASTGVRDEVFPTLRKLRTESNWGSLAAVRNLLHKRATRRDTDEADQLTSWLKELKVHIRRASHGPALVGFRVSDTRETREYDTTGKVLTLVQNGSVFHNERELRRDLNALPEALLDPVVDDGLRQVAELTLALAVVAIRIGNERSLRRS